MGPRQELQEEVGRGVGLKPFLGVVEGFGGPWEEDMVLLGRDDLGPLCWHPIDHHFGKVFGCQPCEGTDAC